MARNDRRILKFPLEHGEQEVVMPHGAIIRHVDVQHDVPTLWAECKDSGYESRRRFVVYGTGQPAADKANYVGTVLMGAFVWHVFEVIG